MNFGWTNTFGGFGSGSGVKKPANPNDILQWLTAYDGVTPFVDKKDEVDSPAVTGVNCLEFDGTGGVTGSADIDSFATANNPFVMTFDGVVGSNDATTHQVLVTLGTDPYAAGALGGLLYRQDSGKVRLRLFDASGTAYQTTTSTVIPLGERFVVKGIYDGTTISLEYNGGAEGTPIAMDSLQAPATNAFGMGSSALGTSYKMQSGGFAYSASVTGLFNLPIAEGQGLPYDVSGNGNHATANAATWTTADDIESANLLNGFYVATQQTAPYIPALTDGSGLAADGSALTNHGGYVHNGAECSIVQTNALSVTYPHYISVTIDSAAPVQFAYDGVLFESPQYVSPEGTEWISKTGSGTWEYKGQLATLGTNPAISYLPPTTGWVSGANQVDLITYSLYTFGGATLWGDGTSWDEVSYADLLAEPSGTTNGFYKWQSINGVCHLKECFQYDVTDVLTETEYNKNAQYVGAGGGCGSIDPFNENALKDSEGDYILDSNGDYIYTAD